MHELTCAQCGDPLTAGYWNIPTPRGLISLCTRCKAAPRLPEGLNKKETAMYNSISDTLDHIRKVQKRLEEVMRNLEQRATDHDASKLMEPEKSLLDALGSQTNLPPYGSAEERARFEALAEFRKHHYAANDHHPEHTPEGTRGMSLLSLMEMLCDWQAAGARHVSGDIRKSLEFNRKRFNLSDELYAILENTVKELGW